MNKTIVYISLALFCLPSCKKEGNNLTKLHANVSDNFILSSIQEGATGEIYCIGENKKTNNTVVYHYNSDLKYLGTIELNSFPEFNGKLTLTHLNQNGWLIASIKDNPTQLSLFVTDSKFQVLSKTIRNYTDKTSINIHELKVLSNGDYLLGMDTNSNRYPTGYGLMIERLDNALNSVNIFSKETYTWEVGSGSTVVNSPRTIELPDQSLFYAYIYDSSGIQILPNGGRFIEYFSIETGYIDKNGKPFNVSSNNVGHVIHGETVGLSKAGNSYIFNFIRNDEHYQDYVSINALSGKVEKKNSPGNHYKNHQIIHSLAKGHFPLGQANPLPEIIKSGRGHFIYNEQDRKLYLMSVDDAINFDFRFPLFLPKFSEIISYRQLFTNRETIIVGTNYVYEGKPYFNLQEVTMDGKVVN